MSFDPYLAEAQVKEAIEAGKVEIKPTPEQSRWLDLKFGMFIHFGINTFNDAEWSDGTLDPSTFNPTSFDADQWCEAAKSAGMKYIVFVTKHHDGFCNFHTRWTDYNVKNSPFKEDVLKLVAKAAEKAGLKLGLYYSLWDRHEPSYSNDHGYAIYMKRHLAELLTKYGEIIEIWFDGGWKKGGVHWQDPYKWFWREIYEHIKTIQPECLIANNGTSGRSGEIILWPCDFRIGEKKVPKEDDRKIWYCGGIGDYLPYESCYTMSKGTGTGMFPGGKWFWHENDINVQDAQFIIDTLKTCNERGGNLLMNVGPDNKGLLRQVDIDCFKEVGKKLGIS